MADVTDRMVEAAQEWMRKQAGYLTLTDEAVRGLIEAALREQPAPEPVAWGYGNKTGFRTIHWLDRCDPRQLDSDQTGALDYPEAHWVWPLYAHPPQRRPLTDEEIHACFQQRSRDKVVQRRLITRAIERAHGIGGEE